MQRSSNKGRGGASRPRQQQKGNGKMPVAILISGGDIIPAILVEKNAETLLQTLNGLQAVPNLETIAEARVWLLEQPEPSGWFETMSEAHACLDRLNESPSFEAHEVAEARATLGMTRESFAEAVGYSGNSNTRHKTIFEMEKGRNSKGVEKRLNPNAARRLRGLLARHVADSV
jgi:DNA-binding XRE family transcriptional regulator